MKKLIILALLIFAVGELSAQKASGTSIYYQDNPVEFVSAELDGSVTVKAWGTGRNKQDAVEQATKQAVHAVLFKGVDARGQVNTMSRALLLETNAEAKYQYFFNPFFSDRGDYKNFISREDTRPFSKTRLKGKSGVKYGITVRVLRSELQTYLIEEGIIKP